MQKTRERRRDHRLLPQEHERRRQAVLEVSRDITAQLRAEEALRETEKLAAMGRVAGIIAHEINNPLAAITNIFYLLRNHPSLDEEARRCAEMAEQELQRVSHITRQTLSFYRESKQPISVVVPELLEDVLGLQDRALRTNRIELRKKLSVRRPWCAASRWSCARSFSTSSATPSRPCRTAACWASTCARPRISTTNRRGIVISILDTGVGIRPEDARDLFQPFFSTKSAKGTGPWLVDQQGHRAEIRRPHRLPQPSSRRRAAPHVSASFCLAVAHPMRPSSPAPIRSRQTTREATLVMKPS